MFVYLIFLFFLCIYQKHLSVYGKLLMRNNIESRDANEAESLTFL